MPTQAGTLSAVTQNAPAPPAAILMLRNEAAASPVLLVQPTAVASSRNDGARAPEIIDFETYVRALSAASQPAGATSAASALSPTATATPAAPKCETSPSHPLYCIYTVSKGETLSGIAQEYGLKGNEGLSAAQMLAHSNKPDVINSDSIVPGQKLRIPLQSGIIHTVFVAETLSEVAQQYGSTAAAIQAMPGNRIADPNALIIGQEIIVPNPSRFTPLVAPTLTPTPSPTPSPTGTPEATPTVTEAPAGEPETVIPPPPAPPAASATPTATATATRSRTTPTATPTAPRATSTPRPAAAAAASRSGFVWPGQGPISSYFGPAHPLGIDIDFYASPNQPVVAAKSGTVTFAGGNACCSYGLYVIVDHGDGWTTLYAHLDRIAVSAGQRIGQGSVLGTGGRSGYATGNHLHYEMRLNGAIVNPLTYLP